MSAQFVDPQELPAKRAGLPLLLSTALTLAAVLAMAVWLLRGDGTAGTAVTPTVVGLSEAPARVSITGHERGGLAELVDDLGMGRRQFPPPIDVYLVANEEQRAAAEHGLTGDAIVVVGDTPDELAIASARLQLLEMAARALHVVNLRAARVGSSAGAPHATARTADDGE